MRSVGVALLVASTLMVAACKHREPSPQIYTNIALFKPLQGVLPYPTDIYRGWPVLIFQHDLEGNRLDAGGIADTFADQGYVVVSIDLPLHEITTSTNAFYDAANERTFNLDLVDNSTLASPPDGIIDDSGTAFVNAQNPVVMRDNLRQAAADLLTLVRSLGNLNLDASPGGGVAEMLFDSPRYGTTIRQDLAAEGIAEGTTRYAEYMRDVQTAVDAADPINYIVSAAATRPLLLLQVVGGGALAGGGEPLHPTRSSSIPPRSG
jgi:hypothetical protein